MTSTLESVIQWNEDNSCNVRINLPLRKAGIGGVTCYEDHMRIWFMNGTGLSILYPVSLDKLLILIEKELIKWDAYYEGYGLQGHIIQRIMNHLKENINEIKEALKKLRN